MKYLVFIVLLQCILAAEIPNSICTDGTQCSQGKYCCELPNGKPGCCDLPKDLQDKGFVPGLPISSPTNVSMPEANVMNAPCWGTQCGLYCVPQYTNGVCCARPGTACPAGHKCCGPYSEQWCCQPRTTCTTIYKMCRNNAVNPSVAMISVLFAFMIGMASKYLL